MLYKRSQIVVEEVDCSHHKQSPGYYCYNIYRTGELFLKEKHNYIFSSVVHVLAEQGDEDVQV